MKRNIIISHRQNLAKELSINENSIEQIVTPLGNLVNRESIKNPVNKAVDFFKKIDSFIDQKEIVSYEFELNDFKYEFIMENQTVSLKNIFVKKIHWINPNKFQHDDDLF